MNYSDVKVANIFDRKRFAVKHYGNYRYRVLELICFVFRHWGVDYFTNFRIRSSF